MLYIYILNQAGNRQQILTLSYTSHSRGQFAVGDNEKNKTIVIFVFIFTPKW